jgi:hypothetical protein
MPNEIQQIEITVFDSADSYELTFDGETVDTLNNEAASIEAGLESLPNIGSGNVSVTETVAGTTFEVEFIGALANTNVPQMTGQGLVNGVIVVTTLQEGGATSTAGIDRPIYMRGGQITLTGSGFTGAISVTFNGVPADFTVDSDTQITAIVPMSGNVNGPIIITLADTVTEVEAEEPFELLPVSGMWHLAA